MAQEDPFYDFGARRPAPTEGREYNFYPLRLPDVDFATNTPPVNIASTGTGHPFKILPVSGVAKVTIQPGTVNLLMADIAGVALDAATAPELSVVDGPVWVEILYSGANTASATIKNGSTMPANVSGVMPRRVQLGTVDVSGTTVTVTAQLIMANLTQAPSIQPFALTGCVDPSGPTSKIFINPGLISRQVPKIGGTSVNAQPPPFITVTGATGIIELRATVDAGGRVTVLDAANVASASTDTDTYKFIQAGTWTASGGAFTSVQSLLSENYALFVCNGVVLLET